MPEHWHLTSPNSALWIKSKWLKNLKTPIKCVFYFKATIYLPIPYLTSVLKKRFFSFFLPSLFIFRERGKEGERKGGKHQCVLAFQEPPTGDPAHNPGMCPDWESHPWHWFTGRHSIHWATSARANLFLKIPYTKTVKFSYTMINWIFS